MTWLSMLVAEPVAAIPPRVKVTSLIGGMAAPERIATYFQARLASVVGLTLAATAVASVVLTPAPRPNGRARCAIVVASPQGRRVVEASDPRPSEAVERAFRLLAFSLDAMPLGTSRPVTPSNSRMSPEEPTAHMRLEEPVRSEMAFVVVLARGTSALPFDVINVPAHPPNHTSAALRPQMASMRLRLRATTVHRAPSKRAMTPFIAAASPEPPLSHTSSAACAHTACRSSTSPVATGVHVEPSKCSTVPTSPTTPPTLPTVCARWVDAFTPRESCLTNSHGSRSTAAPWASREHLKYVMVDGKPWNRVGVPSRPRQRKGSG
jgi:hypothetical protein